jgi:hypothetical protein
VNANRRLRPRHLVPAAAATALGLLVAFAAPANAVERPADARSPEQSPRIVSVRVSRISLPSRGGTVTVTTRTTGADACRVMVIGHSSNAGTLPRSWVNCSTGHARASVDVGPNTSGSTIAIRLRDYARRGLRVTWRAITLLLRAGQLGIPAPPGASDLTESSNWSGYVIPSSSARVDSVSGEWTVPTLNCTDTPNASVSEWVGLGGVSWPGGGSSGALLQTGTEDRCDNGVQHDDAWWELYPSNPNESIVFQNFIVQSGDEINADVHETANGRWTTKVDDTTAGTSGIMVTGGEFGTALDRAGPHQFSEQGSSAELSYGGAYSAEWIVEDSGASAAALVPFANYGSISFTNLWTGLASWALTAAEGVQLVQHGVALSTPGAPAINAFDVRYTGP